MTVVIGIALLAVAALLVVACVAVVLGLQGKVARSEGLAQKTAQQIQHLENTVRTLEARLAQLSNAPAPALSPAGPAAAAPASAAVVAPAAKKTEEEIPAELLAVMAAAVTVFLGKTVRIRSAKMLQSPYEIVNPWAQQGRVFVQASHNLRQR